MHGKCFYFTKQFFKDARNCLQETPKKKNLTILFSQIARLFEMFWLKLFLLRDCVEENA